MSEKTGCSNKPNALHCVKWFTRLLKEIGLFEFISRPQIIFVDNREAIDLMQNSVSPERNKHLDVKCKFVQENITETLDYVMSSPNLILLTFSLRFSVA